LTTPLAALLEDGFEGARNEAATCLGTLMKMVGERPLNAVMDGLADVRKAKVREAYEKATVKCKAGAAAPPKPPPSKDSPAKKKVGANKASDPTLSLDDAEPLALKKPPVKAPAKAAVHLFL
jgi:cytoskeleton-associated protein 5